jgi:hypothetical protein
MQPLRLFGALKRFGLSDPKLLSRALAGIMVELSRVSAE